MSARPMRLAATVLLLRPAAGDAGIEVFMEERHIRSDFVGGAYVFPGGSVDPEDHSADGLCAGRSDVEASRLLGIDSGGLAFFVAAVRECFEEAGVLLAYDQDGSLLDFSDPAREARYRELRNRLNSGELGIAELAQEERLTLATDRIEYWSHWITPEGQPRRYDTRFFVAEAPAHQTATHDDWELTDSTWVKPGEALARARRREWMIIFPTLMTLLELSRFDSVAAALEHAARPREIPINTPRVLGDRIVLPGDEGYDDAERDTSNAPPAIFFTDFWRRLEAPAGE